MLIALRAVETIDFMTARWAHLPPYDLLETVSNLINNEISGVSRVTYASVQAPGDDRVGVRHA